MSTREVDFILNHILDQYPKVSDINVSVGRPFQVEVDGDLMPAEFPTPLPVLTPFQLIVPPTFAATAAGWWAATKAGRARLGPMWLRVHIASMGGTVIAWSTGFAFQIVNGVGFDLRDPKVTITTFAIPTLIGSPLIERAIRHRSRPSGRGQQVMPRVVTLAER